MQNFNYILLNEYIPNCYINLVWIENMSGKWTIVIVNIILILMTIILGWLFYISSTGVRSLYDTAISKPLDLWWGLAFLSIVFAIIFGILSVILPLIVSKITAFFGINTSILDGSSEWWTAYLQGISNAIVTSIILGLILIVTVEDFEQETQLQTTMRELNSSIDIIATRAFNFLIEAQESGEITQSEFDNLFSDQEYRGINLSFNDLSVFPTVENSDLSLSNFSFAIFSTENSTTTFSTTNFSGAEMRGIFIQFATLDNINFSGSNLLDADFSNSNISNVNFSGSNLEDAIFSGVTFDQVNFSGAELSQINFSGSQTTDTFIEVANSTTFINVDFSNSVLNRAVMIDVNYNNANFFYADLTGSILIGATIPRSNFRLALLNDATLSNSNLEYSDFVEAQFINANLNEADLRCADLRGADFTGANLRDARLMGANLEGAIFHNADLSFANLSGANLTSVDFSDANMGGITLTVDSLDESIRMFDGEYYSEGESPLDDLLILDENQTELCVP